MTRPDDQPTPPAGPAGQQPPSPGGPWGQQPPGTWGQQPPAAPGPWAQQPPAPGAPDPAAGPVDWVATPPPAYGQQPPPGYWYGQQPPPAAVPPAGSNTTTIVLITVGGAVLLVGLLAVLLGVTLRGDDDAPVAAPAATTSAPATAVAPDGLVAALPGDLTDCAVAEPAGDGDVAAATCGPADTQPGPAEADFHLYPDVATLDAVFLDDAADLGLQELPGDVDCSTASGYGEWTYATGATGGLLACGVTDDGQVVIAWTDDEFLVEGALLAPGDSQEDVAALYEWWTRHSDYTG